MAQPVTEPSTITNLRPLAEPTSLSDEVADRLREAISNGALAPGARLVERELASQLGISRMPVREAIQQLVEEGLVMKEPRRGAYVHPYNDRELEEIYSLRVALEQFMVERVMAKWSPDHATRLQAIVDAMAESAQAADKRRVYELDNEFHEALWFMAEHRLLLEVISRLRARISRFLQVAHESFSHERLMEWSETHQQLVDVLSTGDVEQAKREISEHILTAKNRIQNYYQFLDGDNS
jgi:DNA-binding GntR family transcriptional regulator